MKNIVDSLYQKMENEGIWFQANIFETSCDFRNIKVDGELLTISTDLTHREEKWKQEIGFDENNDITFTCSCERKKPCMHSWGFFLYCRSNGLFAELESKAVGFKSKSFSEILEEDHLKKLSKIQYEIVNADADQYKFNCTIVDEDDDVYEDVKIEKDMKIVDGHCIFYTLENKGFYYENEEMLNKFLVSLLDGQSYSKTDALYLRRSMDAYSFSVDIIDIT